MKERLHLQAADLDILAKCPLAVNFLEHIRKEKLCTACLGMKETAKFYMQKCFKGGNLPTEKSIRKRFTMYNTLSETSSQNMVSTIQKLERYSKSINSIGLGYQLHLGRVTIEDKIDTVLYLDKVYTMVLYECNNVLKCHYPFSYKVLAGSIWLRESYDVEINNVLIVDLIGGANLYSINLNTEFIKDSIMSIISKIDVENKIWLSPVFGQHCWQCMGCVKDNVRKLCGSSLKG